jgi:hypothetical protein
MGDAHPLLAALSGARHGALHRRVLLTVSAMFFFDLADLNTGSGSRPPTRSQGRRLRRTGRGSPNSSPRASGATPSP